MDTLYYLWEYLTIDNKNVNDNRLAGNIFLSSGDFASILFLCNSSFSTYYTFCLVCKNWRDKLYQIRNVFIQSRSHTFEHGNICYTRLSNTIIHGPISFEPDFRLDFNLGLFNGITLKVISSDLCQTLTDRMYQNIVLDTLGRPTVIDRYGNPVTMHLPNEYISIRHGRKTYRRFGHLHKTTVSILEIYVIGYPKCVNCIKIVIYNKETIIRVKGMFLSNYGGNRFYRCNYNHEYVDAITNGIAYQPIGKVIPDELMKYYPKFVQLE